MAHNAKKVIWKSYMKKFVLLQINIHNRIEWIYYTQVMSLFYNWLIKLKSSLTLNLIQSFWLIVPGGWNKSASWSFCRLWCDCGAKWSRGYIVHWSIGTTELWMMVVLCLFNISKGHSSGSTPANLGCVAPPGQLKTAETLQ